MLRLLDVKPCRLSEIAFRIPLPFPRSVRQETFDGGSRQEIGVLMSRLSAMFGAGRGERISLGNVQGVPASLSGPAIVEGPSLLQLQYAASCKPTSCCHARGMLSTCAHGSCHSRTPPYGISDPQLAQRRLLWRQHPRCHVTYFGVARRVSKARHLDDAVREQAFLIGSEALTLGMGGGALDSAVKAITKCRPGDVLCGCCFAFGLVAASLEARNGGLDCLFPVGHCQGTLDRSGQQGLQFQNVS